MIRVSVKNLDPAAYQRIKAKFEAAQTRAGRSDPPLALDFQAMLAGYLANRSFQDMAREAKTSRETISNWYYWGFGDLVRHHPSGRTRIYMRSVQKKVQQSQILPPRIQHFFDLAKDKGLSAHYIAAERKLCLNGYLCDVHEVRNAVRTRESTHCRYSVTDFCREPLLRCDFKLIRQYRSEEQIDRPFVVPSRVCLEKIGQGNSMKVYIRLELTSKYPGRVPDFDIFPYLNAWDLLETPKPTLA